MKKIKIFTKPSAILLFLQFIPIVILFFYFILIFFITQTNNKEQSILFFDSVKNSFIETNKNNIKEIIEKIKVEIIYEKEKSLEDFKLKLEKNIQDIIFVSENISSDIKTSNEQKLEIIKILSKTLIDSEIKNKYFIYDNKNNKFIQKTPNFNESHIDSLKESLNISNIISTKKEYTNIYVTYTYLPKLDLIIGTCADYSFFENQVKDKIIKKTNKTFLGNYIFIHDHEKFEVLAHFKENVVGEKLTKEKDFQRYKNLQEIKKVSTSGGGFLTYTTEKNSNENKWETKISYVQSIPDWNWSIGTGFYIDDVEKILSEKETRINKLYITAIENVFIISSVLLIFFMLLLVQIGRRARKKFNDYQSLQFFEKASLIKNLSKKEKELNKLEEIINSYVIKTTINKDGLVVYSSGEFCNILNIKKEDILNKEFLSFNYFDEDFLKSKLNKNQKDLKFEDIIFLIEKFEILTTMTYCFNQDKTKKISFKTLIFKENNNYSLLRRDITQELENARLIEQLNKLNESLETQVAKELDKNLKKELIFNQQSKLASLGELLGMIAHQWRHPLSNITINTLKLYRKLLEGKLNEEELKPIIGEIEKITKDLSYTITNFLNFYKPDFQNQIFNVNSTIKSVLKIVFPETYNIKVIFDEKNDIDLNGYKSQFQQVLLTILVNIFEQFQISKTKEPIIQIILKEENGYMVLTIHDNAGGINDKVLDIIFNPYISTKKNKNSGLGLYIAKKIITQFNGSLRAYNEDDGAKFEIKIRI